MFLRKRALDCEKKEVWSVETRVFTSSVVSFACGARFGFQVSGLGFGFRVSGKEGRTCWPVSVEIIVLPSFTTTFQIEGVGFRVGCWV